MLFSSLSFLFTFLPLLLVLYYSINNIKYRNIILLIFSLFFYAWGEPVYIVLMIFSITCGYFLTLFISTLLKKNQKNNAKLILILAILINIGLLGFYKYSDFLIININNIFNLNIKTMNLPLPIGISFYTFQILSYIFDVYNGKVKVQKNILTLATYISSFPQLIAGPIVRYITVEDELKNRKITISLFANGFRRFIIGLGKKVIIANQMAIIADTIFSLKVENLGTSTLWMGAIAYAFQIYFDFSGYSDMAIGLGKMLGFNFLENFNYPYIAQSITDFWRRWHISLSSWFRDYIYIPLGGNRVSKIKWFRNIFIVWFITGLWHGASWNFVIWGLYFGLILVIEKLFLLQVLSKAPQWLRHLYAIILILIGWVIFRADNMLVVISFIKNMFIYKSVDVKEFFTEYYNIVPCLPYSIIAIIGSMPIVKIFKTNQTINKYLLDIFLVIIFILSIMFLENNSYNPFIYFRF